MTEYAICPVCNLNFKPTKPDQEFCSAACRNRAEKAEFERIMSVEPDTVKCEICGNEFVPSCKTAKYCSVGCRMEANRRRTAIMNKSRGKNKQTKKCAICGKEFETARDRQVYCSSECAKEAHRIACRSNKEDGRTKKGREEKSNKVKERPLTPDTKYLICSWYKRGDDIRTIASILSRSTKLVEDVLREAKLIE